MSAVIDRDTGEILDHDENPSRYWAESVKAEWRKTVSGVIETGKVISEALSALGHGDKSAFYSMLPFSESTAQRLVAIAAHPRMSNPAHVQDLLPANWGTLYELTKLDDGTWDYAVDHGLIRPEMERRDVRKLLAPKHEKPPPPVIAGRYRTIVMDPPWDVSKIDRDVRPNQAGFDYPTMSVAELSELELPAADECHLYCWTTQKYLPETFKLLESWGFKYLVTMVWHKPGGFQPAGLPQYNCEFVVLGRRGGQGFIDTKAFSTCFNAERREHSRKPDQFYELVSRVSPEPRIDIFSREKRPGFDQFGNETEKYG